LSIEFRTPPPAIHRQFSSALSCEFDRSVPNGCLEAVIKKIVYQKINFYRMLMWHKASWRTWFIPNLAWFKIELVGVTLPLAKASLA
jgi:hypothetical protein